MNEIGNKSLPTLHDVDQLACSISSFVRQGTRDAESARSNTEMNDAEAVRQQLRESVHTLNERERLYISDLFNAHAHDGALYIDPLFLSLLGFSAGDRQSLYDRCTLSDDQASEYLGVFAVNINKPKMLTCDERIFLSKLGCLSGFGAEEIPLADTVRKQEILRQFREEALAHEAVCVSGW